jgi:uncharacterized protein YndB with AHSA1/START domain
MPVHKDESGRRYVQAEVQVPGSPEVVWEAIASGPGISSWFVPTTVEQRQGGTTVSNFGPGMESNATITEWDPPRRFVAESPEDMGPGSPSVATEWIVEAQSGGTCTVRVVHSWFADTDDWDEQFEQHELGWAQFFKILELYLRHFAGQPCSAFQVMGVSQEEVPDAWFAFTRKLGTPALTVDQEIASAGGSPELAGVVEDMGPDGYPVALIRLSRPTRGVAHMFPIRIDQVYISVRLYLYGDRAASAAPQAEASWQAWMARHFPFPGQTTA